MLHGCPAVLTQFNWSSPSRHIRLTTSTSANSLGQKMARNTRRGHPRPTMGEAGHLAHTASCTSHNPARQANLRETRWLCWGTSQSPNPTRGLFHPSLEGWWPGSETGKPGRGEPTTNPMALPDVPDTPQRPPEVHARPQHQPTAGLCVFGCGTQE